MATNNHDSYTTPPPRLERLNSFAQKGLTLFPSLVQQRTQRDLILRSNPSKRSYTLFTTTRDLTISEPFLEIRPSSTTSKSYTIYLPNPFSASYADPHTTSPELGKKLATLTRDSFHLTSGKHFKIEHPSTGKYLLALEVHPSKNTATCKVLNFYHSQPDTPVADSSGNGTFRARADSTADTAEREVQDSATIREPRTLTYVGEQAGVLAGDLRFEPVRRKSSTDPNASSSGGKDVVAGDVVARFAPLWSGTIDGGDLVKEWRVTVAPGCDACIVCAVAVGVAASLRS